MRTERQLNQRLRFSFLFLALLGLGCAAVGSAHAGMVDHALQKALHGRPPSDRIPVIVHLAEKADLRAARGMAKSSRRAAVVRSLRSTADTTQRGISTFLRQRKAEHVRSLWVVNAVAAMIGVNDIKDLAGQPGVERVVLDAVVHAPVTTMATSTVPEWNLDAIHAPDLWGLGFTGSGVVVANMDTGVDYDHPDLQLRWRGGLNSWFDPHNEHPLTPYDATGHGTQTMGLMVGGDAGGTAVGVAPGAQWIAVKLFNDADVTTYSVIHQGFQWLLDPDGDPDTDDAPDVVNNSWGLVDANHECILEFQSDVQALKGAGIVLAFSAGNDGPAPATSLSPANYPESFSVGSVDSTNTIAASSSRGPSACYGDHYPFVVAPGVNVRTTDLYLGIPDAYVSVSGTSFAAPHVAGAMALLLDAFPAALPNELEHVLRATASDLGAPGADNDFGAGLVDVLAASAAMATFPSGSIAINGGAGSTGSRWVTLSISATDPDGTVSDMRFSWDNVAWYAWETLVALRNATLPAGADGLRTIHVQFRDNAGNHSAVYTDSILLDQTTPTGSVAINGGAAMTNSRAVILSLNATDASSAVTNMRFSWDYVTWYGWEAYATTRNATLPAGDGLKTIYVRFRDGAGNVSGVFTDQIILDTTAPMGSVEINGVACTNNRAVTLSLSAMSESGAVTHMRFSWNMGASWYAWEPYASTRNATIPATTDGNYTISVQFRDSAGNVSPAYSDSIFFDTTGPAGSVRITGGAPSTDTRYVILTLYAADMGCSYVTNMRFSWDNVTWYAWESYATTRNATIPAGPDVTYTIYVQFRDALGNVSGAYTDQIVLDTTAPTGSVVINGGAATTSTRAVVLTLSATDAGNPVSTMRFSWDGVNFYAWEPYATTRNANIPSAAPGTYTIGVQFRDAAGNNISTTYSDSIDYVP